MADQSPPQPRPDTPAKTPDPPGIAQTAGEHSPVEGTVPPPAAEEPIAVPAPEDKAPEAKPNTPAQVDDPPGVAHGILQKDKESGGPQADRVKEDIEALTFAAELADKQHGWPPSKPKP
jgi:hypothetical protein